MQEAAAAHEAFARVLAVDHAVDAGEIGRLVAFAGAGRVELAGARLRIADALGGRGMGGEEIGRARVDVRLARVGFQLGITPHRAEEARGAERIIAGARGNADAASVRLEFLRAREARERDLRFRQRQRSGFRIAQHVLHDAAHQCHLACLVLAHGGMARDHVRHFVGEHRGELRRVVRQRDQSARYVELPGRQREGVDRPRVEDGDAILHVRPLGRRDQLRNHLVEQPLELGIVVGAVIGGENALMLARGRSRRLWLLLGLSRRLGQRARRRADREQR